MSRPIGVFDAGSGGLTIIHELERVMPLESTLFLTDDARVPYGPRPPEQIRQFTLECLDYLRDLGVKAILIACNTATTAALEAAQERYEVPIIGVVGATAGVAAEVAVSRVGVIGTDATVNSGQYARAIRAANPRLEVYQEATPLLAGLIEAGQANSKKTESILEGYLHPLRERQVDTLVLGCTHYPLSRPVIEKLMGPQVKIVDSGPCTVALLVAQMDQGRVERASGDQAPIGRLMTTGDPAKVRTVAAALWPGALPEVEVVSIASDG